MRISFSASSARPAAIVRRYDCLIQARHLMHNNLLLAGIATLDRRLLYTCTARRPVARLVPVPQLARHYTSGAPPSVDDPKGKTGSSIIFSKDQPPELPRRLSELHGWSITPAQTGILRTFTFPSFASAWRFMTAVADECKAKRHHPSWHNLYNQVTIEWTTHNPRGLSIKDVHMAEFCDRAARENEAKD